MAKKERIAYESVNVITTFKLMTFQTHWINNILLQHKLREDLKEMS